MWVCLCKYCCCNRICSFPYGIYAHILNCPIPSHKPCFCSCTTITVDPYRSFTVDAAAAVNPEPTAAAAAGAARSGRFSARSETVSVAGTRSPCGSRRHTSPPGRSRAAASCRSPSTSCCSPTLATCPCAEDFHHHLRHYRTR